jgi:hypothetical protein
MLRWQCERRYRVWIDRATYIQQPHSYRVVVLVEEENIIRPHRAVAVCRTACHVMESYEVRVRGLCGLRRSRKTKSKYELSHASTF